MIRAATLVETPWANGAGRKADIAIGDGWLLGFAWLDRDAPFSDYRGHDRTIMLLEGPGFSLDLPQGRMITLTEPYQPAAFDGAGPIACKINGPCRVLNAISTYPGMSHIMQVVTPRDLIPAPNQYAVILRGTLGEAGPLDTLLPTEPAAPASDDALIAVIRFEKDADA
jgi:environmental stress-induced protein Ves